MFETTFAHINDHFSFNEDFVDDEDWKLKISDLIICFNDEFGPHFNEITAKFPNRLFEKSRQEYVSLNHNHIALCEYRIRPFNDYYLNVNKSIPTPDNPEGPSATGLEVNISMYRAYQVDNIVFPASIDVQFQIWGHRERSAFRVFYSNYKRSIDLLLQNTKPDFFSSCVFDNLESYKGSNIVRKLERYYQNKNDPEANFSFSSKFNKNSELSKLKQCLEIYLILYDCCYGYSEKQRSFDRILNYLQYIK